MRIIKDKVAQSKGYPNWDEMYNWIAREGERPEVVAQLIESAMIEYFKELVSDCEYEQNKEYYPTGDQVALAYKEGGKELERSILENL